VAKDEHHVQQTKRRGDNEHVDRGNTPVCIDPEALAMSSDYGRRPDQSRRPVEKFLDFFLAFGDFEQAQVLDSVPRKEHRCGFLLFLGKNNHATSSYPVVFAIKSAKDSSYLQADVCQATSHLG
jgi:hypothetical protein